MQRSRSTAATLGVALALGGCAATDFTPLCLIPPNATAQQRAAAVTTCSAMGNSRVLDLRSHTDINILFVVANSPSMAPKQKALAAALRQFIQAIETTDINYHIGVITTDVGTATASGTPFPGARSSACSSFAGDDGVLQNIPCTNRSGLSAEAAAACSDLCPDPRFVPAHGARYISKSDGITNVPSLIIDGVDVGPQRAFQCLALVGDGGCEVTQPLAAVRRALDEQHADNTGFNSASSVLAVLFITDQDDCSVPLLKRQLLDPATPAAGQPECERGSKTVDGFCFNQGFRCTAKNLVCSEPLNTPGAKTGCKEDPNSFLEPVDEYVDFFARLPNSNVVLAGIWSPSLLDNPDSLPQPDQGGLYVDYDLATARNSAGLGLGRKSAAACNNPDPGTTMNPDGFFGQTQLRLSKFIRRFDKSNFIEQSICEPAGYLSAINFITESVNGWGANYCLPQVPKRVAGKPQCAVGYIDAVSSWNTPDVRLPTCSDTCCNFFATDHDPWAASNLLLHPNPHRVAGTAACGAEPADCYCAVPNSWSCGTGALPGVWRKGNAPFPSGKIINFSCAY